VIVRTKDKVDTIVATLRALRDQTVPAEIVVVDSGSTDGTLELARPLADRIVELPPERFTYGRALNVGAEAARAPVHFALSAHCLPSDERWVERALRLHERSDVAATNGTRSLPDGTRPASTFYQDHAHARSHPWWGFTNHASSWRADVWAAHRFDESMVASEDREWALRVLREGWTIAFEPGNYVPLTHRRQHGLVELFRRHRREAEGIASFTDVRRPSLGQTLHEWWSEMPPNGRAPTVNRLNPYRVAGILGKHAGLRTRR
jgi:rhamnosyltransferase